MLYVGQRVVCINVTPRRDGLMPRYAGTAIPVLGGVYTVREIFGKPWKRLGRPIEYDDLNDVADIIVPGGEPDAAIRRRIVAAVEAAGIKIHNLDSFRQWCDENTGGLLPSLTADATFALIEEHRWRWPED